MRIRAWLQAWMVLVAMVSPAVMLGQFQQPTPEELSMTSEPKAPGAAAIYLYREETVDDNLHFHSFYARIKVLSEKGKELATVGVPYPKGKFQITDVKARTIHPDGKVIPLEVKPADLLLALNGRGAGQINKMVFTLPDVEVGSILEYRWQLRYDDELLSSPDWEIQQPYYVRKAHYAFTPFKSLYRVVDNKGNAATKLLYSTLLPNDVKVVQDNLGKYTVDISDVRPIPHEEYMPPIDAYLEHVTFYYSSFYSKDDYWKSEGNHWSKEMDRFANESKTLKDAVGTLVAAGDSELVKAQKLYDAVMKIDNTDYSRRRSAEELKKLGLKQTKTAEDVWNQKSGSSDEIALLYLAMARIAGLKAYAAGVSDRERRIFNPYYLSLWQIDDLLVIVSIDGKEKVLDPGEKSSAFGDIGWRHSYAGGLRQSDHGTVFCQVGGNSYKENTVYRAAYLTIAPDGSVSGTARITMTGPEALRWRQMAIENDDTEIQKRFNEHINGSMPDGVHAEFDHFVSLEDPKTPLMGVVKISGNIGTATGKRVFLPSAFFASRSGTPFVAQEKRETPVDMHYADMVTDEISYNLPESYTVESVPPDQNLPWAGHAALQEKSAVKKNTLILTRTFARAFAVLEPKEYGDLRDFYQKIAAADHQQVVLTAAATNKGR